VSAFVEDEERRSRIVAAMTASGGSDRPGLCALSAQVVAVSGAGISLMTEDGAARTTVCSSNAVAQAMEDLQFSLGEGPCVEAYTSDRAVSEPDLAHPEAERWPAFCPAALAAGAAAVFGFPLRAGATCIGTLNLYDDHPGPLSGEQFADALVVADVIALKIISLQSEAPSGSIGDGIIGEPLMRIVVHQATGMIAAQLGVPLGEALLRLRAHAFADGVPIATTAAAVVGGSLRLQSDACCSPEER
jgi:hypothetical protein